jgi:hypothetical protein
VLIQSHVVRKVDGYLHCFTAFGEKTVQSDIRPTSTAVLKN